VYLAELDTVKAQLYPLVKDNVQQEGVVREGGGLNNWSLGGAIDIAKNLSLGAGFNLLSGSYTYDRVYTENDSKGLYQTYDPKARKTDFDRFRYQSTINSDISGYNMLIGLMYRKQGRYKIGFTVRTPTSYEISEDFSEVGTAWYDNGDRYEMKKPGSTKYNVRTPVVLGGGASFQVTDWMMLAGDAEYTDWTQMEFTNDNPDLIEENRVIRDVMQATTNLRGGAEFTLFDLGLKLRGGVVYNPSPYKGDPKDYDQLYYTAGLGIVVDENVLLNASYAIGKWKTYRDNYYVPDLTPPSRTNESVNTQTLNVTLSYRF
jgi:long-subunit fatty acid transport protein